MLTGGFRTATAMELAVAEGDVDIVGLARPMAIEPDLPVRIMSGEAVRIKAEPHRIGIKAFDGFVELMWHTQQLHLMGAGRDPDPGRSSWYTLALALLENGWD